MLTERPRYGSGIAANMLRDEETAGYVKSAILMDPISFMLHLPHVAYNFVSIQPQAHSMRFLTVPQTRRKPSSASEHMLHYFSSQDMMISHTLARRFFWTEFILFKEDLPSGVPVLVILSGRDIIVPTKDVWNYLTDATNLEETESDATGDYAEWTDGEMKVLWFGGLNHAGLFNTKGARRAVVRQICQQSQIVSPQAP